MKLKTFKEMRTEMEVYPQTVDEATRQTINKWFDRRLVCDNDDFPDFFERKLEMRYTQYLQLLRIEAGSAYLNSDPSKFDWAVADYAEFQEKNWKKNDETESREGTRAEAIARNVVLDSDETNGNSRTRTDNLTEGISNTVDGTTGSTNTTTTNSKESNYGEARNGNIQRTSPMSESYTTTEMSENNSRRGYINKTQDGYNAGEKDEPQSGWESDDAEMYSVGLHRNFPDLKIKNPSAVADAHESTTSLNMNDESVSDTTSGTSKNVTAGSKTNTGTQTIVDSGSRYRDDETNETKNLSENSSASKTTGIQGKAETRIVSTGRTNKTIAELLTEARLYIQTTNAFDWLKDEIEDCFYGIWEV